MKFYVPNETAKQEAMEAIKNAAAPFTVSIVEGKSRTLAQNKLQQKWNQEIADQKGDVAFEEVRAYNKLHFGVPILRRDDAYFCERYDTIVKPHSYENKLKFMQGDMFPVTRLMNTKQKTEFLDEVCRHWLSEGIVLTIPQDAGLDNF